MTDPFDGPEMDQAMAALLDLIPRAAYRMYQRFKEEGFSEAQAFRLSRDWLMVTLSTEKEDDD
ncbi:MAG: hypothetical protein QQN63_13735 [Nitrosopumilus sp.]